MVPSAGIDRVFIPVNSIAVCVSMDDRYSVITLPSSWYYTILSVPGTSYPLQTHLLYTSMHIYMDTEFIVTLIS